TGDHLVLALMAPALHDVVTLSHLREQLLDIGRIVLQIPVERHDNFATRLLDTGRHRGGLAVVTPKLHYEDARVTASQAGSDLECPVTAAIVHEHHLVSDVQRVDSGCQCSMHGSDAVLFVEKGDNNG